MYRLIIIYIYFKLLGTKNLLELKNMSLKWASPLEDEFITNLSLEVKKGKILTVYGVSGIGKSSLINVISGIFEDNLSFKGDIILKVS